MTHRNAPLTPQGRYRLVMRVQAGRPIAHVVAEVASSYYELLHVGGGVFSHEQARSESQAGFPPHPRRHLGPPDRGHNRPGRSSLPPGRHRDQHRQDRTRAMRPAGGHHQP